MLTDLHAKHPLRALVPRRTREASESGGRGPRESPRRLPVHSATLSTHGQHHQFSNTQKERHSHE